MAFSNANEQVSGKEAWSPVQKLGDFSVPKGDDPGSFFGTLASAVGGVADGAGRTGSFLQGVGEAGGGSGGLGMLAEAAVAL